MNATLQLLALTVMRVGAGLMMATHGYGKIFEDGRMEKFTAGVGDMGFPFPGLFAWLAALSELVGGVCLALGLGTRVSAFLIAGTMFVAAFIRHGADPFAKKELALLYLVVMVYFAVCGGGRWALDKFLGKKG
ncbi:MAG: DoxX family protein [Verrucomicrobia bacterium]|nr:DoxX family protein [Verrucomicrobiota bacterium]